MIDAGPAVVRPSDDFEYYTSDVYWNQFDAVQRAHNLRISGDESLYWHFHFKQRYGSHGTAFILGCGNGWVERDLFQKDIIRRVVGMDVMPQYVEGAQRDAAAIGMPASYICADANRFNAGRIKADLVVNVGAMHHLAYVNRVTAEMAKIAAGGLYVGYDYTGPHRNQYPWEIWSKVVELNDKLPSAFQAKLRYPHMATMLHTDPSEAVHPELQMAVLQRHFDLVEHQPLGGGLAYTLLHNNHRLLAAQLEPEGRAVLQTILEADAELARIVPRQTCSPTMWRVPRPNLLRQDSWRRGRRRRMSGRHGQRPMAGDISRRRHSS